MFLGLHTFGTLFIYDLPDCLDPGIDATSAYIANITCATRKTKLGEMVLMLSNQILSAPEIGCTVYGIVDIPFEGSEVELRSDDGHSPKMFVSCYTMCVQHLFHVTRCVRADYDCRISPPT